MKLNFVMCSLNLRINYKKNCHGPFHEYCTQNYNTYFLVFNTKNLYSPKPFFLLLKINELTKVRFLRIKPVLTNILIDYT